MEPLFVNTTIYSKKEFNSFFIFHRNKYLKKYVIWGILFVIYIIMLAVVNLINKNWIVIGVLAIIAIAIYIYYSYINLNRKKKNNNKLAQQKFKFDFYDKYVVVNNNEKEKLKYFKFYRVFETNTHFYMYINTEYSLIINKQNFTKGTIEEFRKFIKKKCLFKYRKAFKGKNKK